MTKDELIELKKILVEEKEKRQRINSLMNNSEIKEFVKLLKMDNILKSLDDWDIIKDILQTYKIKETNGIYVCTGTFIKNIQSDYYNIKPYPIPFDEFHPYKGMFRQYQNIENNQVFKSYMFNNGDIVTTDFETKYLVFNPNNSNLNLNNIEEVQKDFFTTTLEKNQKKAKILLLHKYQQMGPKQIKL